MDFLLGKIINLTFIKFTLELKPQKEFVKKPRVNNVWNNKSYQRKDDNISEKTYRNDIAYSIVDYSLSKISTINRLYDGTCCQSSKNRNGVSIVAMFNYKKNNVYQFHL